MKFLKKVSFAIVYAIIYFFSNDFSRFRKVTHYPSLIKTQESFWIQPLALNKDSFHPCNFPHNPATVAKKNLHNGFMFLALFCEFWCFRKLSTIQYIKYWCAPKKILWLPSTVLCNQLVKHFCQRRKKTSSSAYLYCLGSATLLKMKCIIGCMIWKI